MLEQFKQYINQEKLFNADEPVLLAVSGGIDSLVLAHLFYLAGFKFGIAHCNFQLRDSESDGDEAFVRSWAEERHITFHCKKFDTMQFASSQNLSTQMAARELRYQWFAELMEQYGYSYTATAHHLDDQIETFFLNIIRGTGIAGLHGIAPKKGKIIRPLLFLYKVDILKFVKENSITFREDSSNKLTKYKRNKIRLKFFPLLQELNPSFEKSIIRSIDQFKEAEIIFDQAIENVRKNIFQFKEDLIYISIDKLLELNPLKTYLYEFLQPYNFNISHVEDIIGSLDDISGKQFFSQTHRLVKDRTDLIIAPRREETHMQPILEFKINKDDLKIDNPLEMQIEKIENPLLFRIIKDSSIAFFDFDKLHFPLVFRKWKDGDCFYPFGMGKSKKKISDFYKDMKFSVIDKENQWLLCSGNDIIWVIGYRTDERYKLTEKTKTIFKISLINNI